MFCGEPESAGLLACAQPDCAGSADEREGIVADQLSRAFQCKGDGIVGVGADGAELVGDAKDDAGGVGSVGVQFAIIGQQREFGVDSACRTAIWR